MQTERRGGRQPPDQAFGCESARRTVCYAYEDIFVIIRLRTVVGQSAYPADFFVLLNNLVHV